MMLKLESDCVGTMYAKVHGQEIPIAYLISEVRWQKGCTNYEELKERCSRIELDDKALKRAVRKIKWSLLWLSIKNLFTK